MSDRLYQGLHDRAAQSNRSMQEEAVHVLSLLVPGGTQLPADLQAELDRLHTFNDEQLWKAARTRVSEADSERLEDLIYDARERQLTPEEENQKQRLLREHNRVMLVRGQAAVLLRARGHDISELAPPT